MIITRKYLRMKFMFTKIRKRKKLKFYLKSITEILIDVKHKILFNFEC